ncbi:CotH kinase family protein [Barnesiella propionica]|uniref:CotH kinase family protein n=1 Tax=Barnesiella propionica TaxID=2981781 RepID=UPI0011C9BAEC|nr:CotH kinase family protein [Barnesiella propionica]MCU6767477.1 CotH kinase family protein [Barnesiella propionica]
MTIIRGKSGKYLLSIIFALSLYVTQSFAQEQLTNLPTLYITTENGAPVVDKENYVSGNVVIKSSDPTEELSAIAGIRLRGNSTFRMDKKAYRIKFDKKANVLNLPAKAKSWVLLANYADKTLIRNALAFKISTILGFEFTPSVRFVDVVLNGTYLGNYMLTDQIQVDKNRVNVVEQEGTEITEPDITGGYLIEQAGDPTDEPVWFLTEHGMKLVVKSPDSDVINSTQLAYIKKYFADYEKRLFSADFADPEKGYRAMVDTVSLVNWYIACELTGNPDSFWSTYFYKKRSDDKLYYGPLWDYDIAFNNDKRLGDATRKFMRDAAWDPKEWIHQLWRDDWFRDAVCRRWQKLIADDLSGSLLSYIDETAQLIDASQKRNFETWDILDKEVYLENYLFKTYQEGIDYLKSYVEKRIEFLTENFSAEPQKPSEPFVPDNYYYAIKNKKTGNWISVNQNSLDANEILVMWEPLENNDAQLWEMKQIEGDLFQIINKNSGLAMTRTDENINLIQTSAENDNPDQQWYIKPVNTGNMYGIVNKRTGKSVNNSGGNYENGTNAIEYNNNITGSDNQQWYFVPVSEMLSVFDPEAVLSNIEIAPNPAKDKIRISFRTMLPQDIIITINDLQGIKRYEVSGKCSSSGEYTFIIPLNGFDAGLYLVNISGLDKGKIVKKLIVKY